MRTRNQPRLELSGALSLEVRFKDRKETYCVSFDGLRSSLASRELIEFFRTNCTACTIEYRDGLMEIFPDPEG